MSCQEINFPHSADRSCQVGFFNSINCVFFSRRHPLQLFLSRDGSVNVSKDLVPNQTIDIVCGSKTV